MPELPEVQTTVDGLKQKVLKRAFVDVWSDWKKLVKKPKDFEQFKKEIKNKKIKKVWRRAKNIIFDLSENYSLLVHQKMTGHLLVGNWELKIGNWVPTESGPLNDPYNRFLHLIFFLDNKKMLALSDARKFAKVELWKTDDLLKDFEKLGPEPLEKSFTFSKFKKALLRPSPPSDPKGTPLRQGKVKQVIMDPSVIAGIGNIYASEALWQAKIHPEKSVAKLSGKELELLYQAIRKVLALAVKLGGESFSDYRKPDGTKGDFDTERKVYKRENQLCKRCKKAKIKRIKFAGRSAFYCPNCQKL
ncbi:MAG: bifunctional DNA-formamidopyrimidine glycosylase/DNA-(apurinic or apyrimidinic site) lyase [Candidatus Staskawiczbacteria bacterium]|nr:bifunctional DNA-formamidopyrimidine glycosylase/DNA-(apurinic or apyrimidinic site) lyase [Candidatus Staskawiczbacteria bacterium]